MEGVLSAETKVNTRPPDDVVDALDMLTQSEKARIQAIAKSYAKIMGIEWEELFHEAIARTLERQRNCPEDVHPIAFIAGVMKGLKSDDFRAGKRRQDQGFGIISQGDLIDDLTTNTAPSPEDMLIAKENDGEWIQSYDKLLEAFKGDDDIQYILIAMQEGFEGKALREEVGLDETTYNSARRRLRRKTLSGNLSGLKS